MSNIHRIMAKVAYLQKLSEEPALQKTNNPTNVTVTTETDILRQYLKNDYIRTLLGMGGGALLGAGTGALTGINPVLTGFGGATAGGIASAIAPHMIESLIKDNIIS